MGERRADGRALDPDELALLEEERDHLLTSLEDLEREHDAGDLDEVDYLELRDDYTARAGEVLEAIEHRHALRREQVRPARRGRSLLVGAAVLTFAVVAGVLVAQSAGQRGDGTISGAVDTQRAELSRCRTASMEDPAAGIECYDELLAEAPDLVEALTYQGWAYIRADRLEEGARNLQRAVEIDPDYPDARAFRAIVAARAGDHERAAEELDRFHRNDPSPAAVQVLASQGLEREVFIQLLDDATRSCWLDAATRSGAGGEEEGADASAFLDALGTCLEGVIERDPDDVDALVSRTYALLAPGTAELGRGAELAARAVSAGPRDPNARLMAASVALARDDRDAARAHLEVLDGLRRPTISFLIGGPEAVRDALGDDDDANSTTSTTAPAGGVSIPNPAGG